MMTGSGGFWIKTAFLFLLRSRRSTAALTLMVVTAVAALIFLSALAVGVNDAMVRNSVSLFSGHIAGMNIPGDIHPESLRVDGVRDVLQRRACGGILAAPGHIETLVLVGVDPPAELRRTALPKKIEAGHYPDSREQAIFISRKLAEALGAGVGGRLEFRRSLADKGTDFTVAGIYQTGIEVLDRGTAFCPSKVLPCDSPTWAAAVFLEKGADPDEAAGRLRRLCGRGSSFKTWSELMPDLRQLIDLNYVSMAIVTGMVFCVVSLGIACAFVIFILKNLREYGIMKAMGVTRREMMQLIFAEVVLMNLGASLAGIVCGCAAVLIVGRAGIDLSAFTSHNRYFAVSGVIYPRLTAFSLWSPPIIAMVFSLAAAVWPSVLLARRKASEILRMV